MIIECNDVKDAVSGDLGSCKFRLIKKANGDIFIGYGCYCLPNLLIGAQQYISYLIKINDRKPIKLDLSNNDLAEILKERPCPRCHGMIFEK